MVTFNTLLLEADVDQKGVRLVRHQDRRFRGAPSPYDAWLADDGRLESYQQIQGRPVFDGSPLIASFVATPLNETLFVGIFEVHERDVVPPGTFDRLTGEDVSGAHRYDLRPSDLLADLRGRVFIDWGTGYRAWVQWADRNDKLVVEIRRFRSEPPFPGYLDFSARISTLASVPPAWRTALTSVSGVYLLVCPDTGRRYIGSAYGQGGFWARWEEYARSGHGGNVGMRDVPAADYQVGILEVASSSATVEAVLEMEVRWKRKLMTREHGLNRN